MRFDQSDIRKEANAFASFMVALSEKLRLNPDKLSFIGYSNGANLIGAVSLLHPELVRQAVLLRPMPVLDNAPQPPLEKSRYLLVSGKSDKLYGAYAPALQGLLRKSGAAVERIDIDAGHMVGEEDSRLIAAWLKTGTTVAEAAPVPEKR